MPAFNWFNQYLKEEKKPVEMFAHTFFEPLQLKVFSKIPDKQCNTRIQDSFTRLVNDTDPMNVERVLTGLREKTFGGWPEKLEPLGLEEAFDVEQSGVRFAGYDFNSQIGIRLRMYITHQVGLAQPKKLHLEVIDNRDWVEYQKLGRTIWSRVWKEEMELAGVDNNTLVVGGIQTAFAEELDHVGQGNQVYVMFMPRGYGLASLTDDERYITQVRRRFMLLGQTLAGMQVWDVRRCLQVVRSFSSYDQVPIELWGCGEMASIIALAALYEPKIAQINVRRYSKNDKEQPDYLNISRLVTPIQILKLVEQRAKVNLLD